MNISKYLFSLSVFPIFLLASACSSSDEAGSDSSEAPGTELEGGGSVELGETCANASECKIPPGQEVDCKCTADSEESVCVTLLEAGEECGGSLGCRSDSVCLNGTCHVYAKLGEACKGTKCEPGIACVDNVCAEARPLGAECDPFDMQPCVPEAYCEFFDRVCKPRATVGGPCEDAECPIDSTCLRENDSSRCVPNRADGEPCGAWYDCDWDSECIAGDDGVSRCTPPDTPKSCGS
jgi:hypothetical protein